MSTHPPRDTWAPPHPHTDSEPYYEAAFQGFAATFRHLGYAATELKRPQNYVAPVARKAMEPDAVHVSFTPPASIRLLKGATNIAYFGADQRTLLTGTSTNPFADPKRMLSLPREVWADSRFARDMLRREGIPHAQFMPMPLADVPPLATRNLTTLHRVRWKQLQIGFGRYASVDPTNCQGYSIADIFSQHYAHVTPLVFLTVLDDTAGSSELHSLIASFLEFHHQTPETLLLIQLSGRCATRDGDTVSNFLRQRPFGFEIAQNRGIWLSGDDIPVATRGELRQLIDGYICNSSLPARNHHLLEYLVGGAIPIGPDCDALAEYITADTGIAFDSRAITPVSRITNALRDIAGLGTERRKSMQRRLRELLAERHSMERVAKRVSARMAQLSAESGGHR